MTPQERDAKREEIMQFAAERIGVPDYRREWRDGVSIGAAVEENGKPGPVGLAVIFHGFTHGCIEMSAAVDDRKLVTRRLVKYVFRTVFDEMGAKRVQAVIQPLDDRARNCLIKLGFQWEGIQRALHDGYDMEMWSMLRSDCRVLHSLQERRNGKRRSTARRAVPAGAEPGLHA